MKAIFLDIDGVLNDGHCAGSFCGIQQPFVGRLNRILRAVPDCQLVISSAWRYYIINGDMKLRGFEVMLSAVGIECRRRVHGRTASDEKCCVIRKLSDYDWYAKTRAKQIKTYARNHKIDRYVVLDDMPMEVPNLLCTESWSGLTDEIADRAINMLSSSFVE